MEHRSIKQPKTPSNPKGSGRPPSNKKMFSFRVEEKHHELLKEIAIYLNNISNLHIHN